MYYYIFQSPKNFSENKIHERIKNMLTTLGIAGESTLVSPARNATELAIMGVEKGYNTIVAIGNDEIINEVASTIQNTGAVLGIIPINASNEIIEILGTNDLKGACDALQKRHLKTINMGSLEPNIYFISSIVISSDKPLSIQAEIDDYYFSTYANRVIINNNLGISVEDYEKESSFLKNLFKAFNKEPEIVKNSFFSAHRLRLRTNEITPVKIGDLTIAKTPIVAYKKPEALKIIQYYSNIK